MKFCSKFLFLIIIGVYLYQAGLAQVPNFVSQDQIKTLNAVSLNGLSTSFEKNIGQYEEGIQYVSKMNGLNLIIKNSTIYFDFFRNSINENSRKIEGHVIAMELLNSPPNLNMKSINKSETYLNYFIGKQQANWHRNIPLYKDILFENAFENIDMILKFKDNFPRYDFIIKPGGNPNNISFKMNGAFTLSCDKEKGLILGTRFGDLYHGKVFAYQEIEGVKKQIECQFTLGSVIGTASKEKVIGFELGNYDKDLPLIVDPVVFSSYFGGTSADEITGIAYDKNGEFVVCGWSESADLQTTSGIYDEYFNDVRDVFIARFSLIGTESSLKFATYIGGQQTESATSIGIDSKGDIYFTGTTNSKDFPVFSSFSNQYHDLIDGFVAKLSADGMNLLYSTYLGGAKDDIPHGIKINADGNAYVIGETKSTDFPVQSALNTKSKGMTDVFLTQLSPSGQSLIFSTYYGSQGEDRGYALDVDDKGIVYFTGETNSETFPAEPLVYDNWWHVYTKKPFDYTYNGNYDCFVVKLAGDGTKVEFSTFFGGSADERGKAILADANGRVFFAGETSKETGTAKFPISSNPYSAVLKGGVEGFFAKLDIPRTSSTITFQDMIFSSYFGGTGNDYVTGMTRNNLSDRIVITGYTNSSNFPNVGDDKTKYSAGLDAYIIEFSTDGSSVFLSDYIGGKKDDKSYGLAIDDHGDTYIAGSTASDDLKTSQFTVQNKLAGGATDGFISKLVSAKISINAPSGGERYCPGTTPKISWLPVGFQPTDEFTAEVSRTSETTWTKIGSVVGEKLDWLIPQNQPPGNDYVIRIVQKSGVYIVSNPFTILSPPNITDIKISNTDNQICEKTEVKLQVEAVGEALKFQWRHGGKDIPNATGAEYDIKSVTLTDAGDYDVVVSGFCNPKVTSSKLSFEVIPATEILSQTSDTSVYLNEKANLYINAKGANLTYQWYKDNNLLTGQTNPSLTMNNASYLDSGYYQCIIQGDCYEDTSSSIKLSVQKPNSVLGDNNINLSKHIRIETIDDNTVGYIKAMIYSDINCDIKLSIVDNKGDLIRKLHEGMINIGINEYKIEFGNFANGIYWIVAECGNERAIQKFQIIK